MYSLKKKTKQTRITTLKESLETQRRKCTEHVTGTPPRPVTFKLWCELWKGASRGEDRREEQREENCRCTCQDPEMGKGRRSAHCALNKVVGGQREEGGSPSQLLLRPGKESNFWFTSSGKSRKRFNHGNNNLICFQKISTTAVGQVDGCWEGREFSHFKRNFLLLLLLRRKVNLLTIYQKHLTAFQQLHER